MHEVIGHASGRQAEGKGNPQALIKEHFSALEEGRADLVGLYFIADPKLVELGVIPAADHDSIVKAEYEAYTRNALVQLRRVREGTQIEEDHMRNRQMIVRWLMANTKAIEQRTRDGKTYLVMVDAKAFRDGVGKLLAEVQRIKSEGDAAAAARLFDTYGIHFDAKLRDEVVARVDKLQLPSYSGFVMPKLTRRHCRGRIDHRCEHFLSAGLDEANAGVLRRPQIESAHHAPTAIRLRHRGFGNNRHQLGRRGRAGAGDPHADPRALLQHLLGRASARDAHQARRAHRDDDDRCQRCRFDRQASRAGTEPADRPVLCRGRRARRHVDRDVRQD